MLIAAADHPENMNKNIPLIVHVIQHFGVGGLENGLANLINHMPAGHYRHAVVCLDGYSDFRQRIQQENVLFFALGQRPGHDFGLYLRLWRLLRELRPALVHTRNLSALEAQFVAAAAGVPCRIHGEHGRDVFDLHGMSRKYNLLRRVLRPLVRRYIALSQDLQKWLEGTVGVAPSRITQIYNGVDSVRFYPRETRPTSIGPAGFIPAHALIIGSVGRMAEVKNFPALVRAFIQLMEKEPTARDKLRLVIIGDGPGRQECLALLQAAELQDFAWLPGESADVAKMMHVFDVFVLPSLGEGISNTILEAMASGLPVVATRVGGNPELVQEGITGKLVNPGDAADIARALHEYLYDTASITHHGQAARAVVEARFTMQTMVNGYLGVYDEVLNQYGRASCVA